MSRPPEFSLQPAAGDVRLSNYLTVKAAEIRNSIDRFKRASVEAHEAYLSAGRDLVEVRGECARGQWAPFLAAVGIQSRTAANMMKLARSGFDAARLSDLGGVRAALESLRPAPSGEAPRSPAARRRAARIAAGECVGCGARLPAGDRRRHCPGCRARISRAHRRRRERARIGDALAPRLESAARCGRGIRLTASEVQSLTMESNHE